MRHGLVLLFALSMPARAGEPMGASASCPAADAPGRVRCSAEAIAPAGSRIAWADVVIVSSPSFVVPLRGRMPPSDATDTRSDRWRFAFAVVAKQRGKGELVLRVRAVLCEKDACRPQEREVRAQVSVGE